MPGLLNDISAVSIAAGPAANGSASARHAAAPSVPGWVTDSVQRLEGPPRHPTLGDMRGSATMHASETGALRLASVRVDDAASARGARFESATARAYQVAREMLRETSTPHPVRIWNFVPGIHDPMGDGLDRYKAFNRGRFEALSAWFGGSEHFPLMLPTASAVGHGGADLIVHILGAPHPGRPVENPRQCPAFRYSTRHGPRPPCFARATVAEINGVETVLIGGTASIRGEETMFTGCIAGQLDELFENMASLLVEACRERGLQSAGHDSLSLLKGVRVYYRREPDRERVEQDVARRLPGISPVECVRADICRPELLVEIEGFALLRAEGSA